MTAERHLSELKSVQGSLQQDIKVLQAELEDRQELMSTLEKKNVALKGANQQLEVQEAQISRAINATATRQQEAREKVHKHSRKECCFCD